jgi:hypothetical protein
MQAVMEQRRKMAEWHKSNAPPSRPGGTGGSTPHGAAGVPAGRMTENKVVDPLSGESFYSEVCHISVCARAVCGRFVCVCGVVASARVILCACRRVRVHVGELGERGGERDGGREGGREGEKRRDICRCPNREVAGSCSQGCATAYHACTSSPALRPRPLPSPSISLSVLPDPPPVAEPGRASRERGQ